MCFTELYTFLLNRFKKHTHNPSPIPREYWWEKLILGEMGELGVECHSMERLNQKAGLEG